MKTLAITLCIINTVLAIGAPIIAVMDTGNWLNLFFCAIFGPMVIAEWYVTLNACKK